MWLGPPLLRVGLEGFRGYLVGVAADRRGGPAGERGREMEEEGETGWLESYFKLFLNNKVQGWIFCCLIPCMFPNMRVQKIWQNRFFVLHTCISNSIWTFEFLTRRNSGVLSLAGHSIYRKCKTNQEHVNDPANNDDKVNQRKTRYTKRIKKADDLMNFSQDWDFKTKYRVKTSEELSRYFYDFVFCRAHLVLTITW